MGAHRNTDVYNFPFESDKSSNIGADQPLFIGGRRGAHSLIGGGRIEDDVTQPVYEGGAPLLLQKGGAPLLLQKGGRTITFAKGGRIREGGGN